MAEPIRPDIAQLLRDRDAITGAIQRAVREAILTHARAGHPVAASREGKVVWLQPEEIFRLLTTASAK
jgi:hypothetical protein